MKKFLVCLFAAAAIFATSCSKDDDDNNGPAAKATATVDGKEYSFGDYVWDFQNDKEYVLFSESLVQENSLTIRLKEKKAGEIAFSEDNSIKVMIGDDVYNSKEGKINVTTADSKVIGTFTGTFTKGILAPTKVTISGSFSANKAEL